MTVLFSDLEGRLHMLDYDKKFLIKSWDNLTFDGSSIRGFTAQRESDLRLAMDWGAFYWGPADVFGSGKVLVFGQVIDKDGTPYSADIRGVLKGYADDLHEKKGYTLNAANEIEGFLFNGVRRRAALHETRKFEYVNTGGYYHSLPGDPLRTFHRHDRGSAARHGLPEREGPPGGGAFAVRNQLRLRRSGRGRRSDSALQIDLPPGGYQHGPDRVLSCRSRWWA